MTTRSAKPERSLRGPRDLACQQNSARAGGEKCAATRFERAQRRLQPLFLQKLQHRGAFAARQNHGVNLGGLFAACEPMIRNAQAVEHARVGLIITLHRKDSDSHESVK